MSDLVGNMLRLTGIAEAPTLFRDRDAGECHESLLRSWAVIEVVKVLLAKKTPPDVILAYVEHCRSLPNVELTLGRAP